MKKYWYLKDSRVYCSDGWCVEHTYGVSVREGMMDDEVLREYGEEIDKKEAEAMIEGWIKDCEREVKERMR